MKEAEAAYQEALDILRQLAKANPAAYQADVAETLNNLAILFKNNERMKEAQAAYQEALEIYRQLAKADSAAYLPDVALTLNNLTTLYKDTQRTEEAEAAFREALDIRRQLAKTNPATYQPDVATTLNNWRLSTGIPSGRKRQRQRFRRRWTFAGNWQRPIRPSTSRVWPLL